MSLSWKAFCSMFGMSLVCGQLVIAQPSNPLKPDHQPIGQKITYKSVGGRSLFLYVTRPQQTTKRAAAALFFHGGGWTGGSPASFNTQAQAVAARDAVAIEVEYRLLSTPGDDAEMPRACVEDTKSAIRWVRSHAAELSIDPQRIAAVGGSAGGYNAAYAAMVPGWDDPSDDLGVSAAPNTLVLLNPVLDVSIGQYGNARFGEHATERSPIEFVSRSAPPTLVLSGSNDTIARPETLRDFQHRMQTAQVRCDLHIYDGQVHGFFNRDPYLRDTTAAMLQFLTSLNYLTSATAELTLPASRFAKPS